MYLVRYWRAISSFHLGLSKTCKEKLSLKNQKANAETNSEKASVSEVVLVS
ncbi:hypothetical protein AALP_AAs60890U000200 [Arabis alpina]|uniref:Uncharacterized protein n=1 Tax=Arabis alpina TaxID=50452 RepID=A0A087FYL1_ARAAL|nr:hypothetical protein AALP_AAs60890U000200 [Arabis alpina]